MDAALLRFDSAAILWWHARRQTPGRRDRPSWRDGRESPAIIAAWRREGGGMERSRSRLTISRKPGEAVRIGDVVVRYAGRNGRRITLVIEAPRDRKIQRVELDGPTQREEFAEVG